MDSTESVAKILASSLSASSWMMGSLDVVTLYAALSMGLSFFSALLTGCLS